MNLLNVVRTDYFGPRKGSVPLMVEFRVNPETAPFLVSSTRSFVWVTPRTDRLRAAIRVVDGDGIGGVFRDIVTRVAEAGADGKWGNVHPFTPEGVSAARAHLTYYDMSDTGIVAHPGTDVSTLGVDDDAVERASWVPDGWAVVLPTDREFVGFLVVSDDRYLTVVHNSSRAVAVVRP